MEEQTRKLATKNRTYDRDRRREKEKIHQNESQAHTTIAILFVISNEMTEREKEKNVPTIR